MRILLHTVPLWAPSGYGVQARLLARGLKDAGHDVIASCYGGFILEQEYEGIPVLACGGSSKGVGRIRFNYERSKADLMIVVADFWPLDAREFKDLNVVSWLPIDCAPLSLADQIQLRAARELCKTFRIVAMSQHGRKMVEGQGYEAAAVIPHMVDPAYTPGSRSAWRDEQGIPREAFLYSTVGVNGDFPCRKAFCELLAAWQPFSERHPDARLYMHTQISPGVEGVDLMQICKTLGIRSSVGFPDQLQRLADQHGTDYMAGMMRASDVGVFATMGEGFGVPPAEFAACGTPCIISDGSALRERATSTSWICETQPSWSKLHGAWWHVPLVESLHDCLEKAYCQARVKGYRASTARQVDQYRPEAVIPQWTALLELL